MLLAGQAEQREVSVGWGLGLGSGWLLQGKWLSCGSEGLQEAAGVWEAEAKRERMAI